MDYSSLALHSEAVHIRITSGVRDEELAWNAAIDTKGLIANQYSFRKSVCSQIPFVLNVRSELERTIPTALIKAWKRLRIVGARAWHSVFSYPIQIRTILRRGAPRMNLPR